jgi:colanic acid/amylovoran biosynthesis glycosyltransferase
MDTKNVLVFVPRFPALSETFIERELSKLADCENVNVTILSLEKGSGVISENIKNKVVYRKLSVFDAAKALPLLFSNFNKLVKINHKIKNWYTVLKAVGYASIFSEYKPDIILAHFLSYPSTLVLIAAQILNVDFGISGHAKDILVEGEFIKEKAEAAKFIAICNKNAYEFVKQQVGPEHQSKIFLQYHGIDFSKPIEPSGLSKMEKPLIVNVGRLVEKKGQNVLIEASKILKQQGFEHYLYILGGGPLYLDLMAQIKELELEDTVKIIGEGHGVPYIEIEKLYKIADVVAFSGITAKSGDVDGIPNVLVEAAFFKVPVITTDAGSTTDLTENNISGLVIPQNDAVSLSEGIKKLATDKALSSTLAEGAYTKAKELFDIGKNVKRLAELL